MTETTPEPGSYEDPEMPWNTLTEETIGDWNRNVIAEFRANGGKVGGAYEGGEMILLTTTGAQPTRCSAAALCGCSTVADYAEIPGLPVDDPAAGEPAEPIALVCTNDKRDVCCAVLGRPIAAGLAGRYDEPVVWECSHTGGHRFAPVLIVLPTGYTYGRVSEVQAVAAVDAARAGTVSTS